MMIIIVIKLILPCYLCNDEVHTITDLFYCTLGYAKMYYIAWQNITQVDIISNIPRPEPAKLKEASAVGMIAEIGK